MLKGFYNHLKDRFVIPHVLFWMVSIVFFLLLLIYTRGFRISEIDLRTAASILVTVFFLAISVYLNLLWLIPRFFKKRKFVLFSILQIGNILLFILLNYFTSHAFEEDHPEFLNEAIAEMILVSLFLIVTTLLKFMRDSIALQDAELKVKEVEGQKIKAELQTLKSQVNPHFFFNTLNSLYSLSLDKSEKTPEMILKLSDLMRYVIYESQDNQVPLKKQLDFLKSYVYLEQMRSDENLSVTFDVSGEYLNTRIDPLLFIAFIENAFKHGCKTKALQPYIHIHFNIETPDTVKFSVENNYDESLSLEENKMAGFGLKNVKKRLDLLYPEKHDLRIINTGTTYRVELCICIQKP
ncbi:MAG: sensor histidine kinase [Bacteroidales bacterium]|nr:sensor histidine kinase [Bacteroidales bacterium]